MTQHEIDRQQLQMYFWLSTAQFCNWSRDVKGLTKSQFLDSFYLELKDPSSAILHVVQCEF